MLAIDATVKDNEMKMRIDMAEDAKEMMEAAGVKNVQTFVSEPVLGRGIHEMGTLRAWAATRKHRC